MAETNANIRVGVDTSDALAQLKSLQRQISVFHTQLASSGKAVAEQSARMQSSLMRNINQTGAFTAQMTTIKTGTESFTNALEKNKLSMGQYFRFAGASTKSFGKLFKGEFNTIQRVAEERVKDLQTQYIKLGRDASGAMKAIKVRPATLDMQNFGTQAAIAAQKTQLLSQILKQGTTNLLNWGKNTQWAGRQLMVGFTVPLTIFGGIAIREFQKIEEQAIKFRRVYGDMFTSTKETEAALDNIRSLADEFTKFGIAVEKTVDLAAKVAQMGNVGAALETQVVQATRLSVLGGMEQMEALDTTISLTNAFKIEIDDLAESVNFLNAAENQTILAIDDFNTAIPLAGSVVKQLGGDVKDLAVLLTAMREGGINASQAGNALKSSLARLIAPSRNAKEVLGGFGIDVMGIVNKNAGDLMGTINVLAHSLNELDPLSRARGIEALFGKFQFARMSTLFSNIVDGGSQASKVLELTTNSAEELAILADRELGRVEESAATKFQKSVQQIQAALAPIGEAFLEVVIPILNVVKDVVESFANMGDLGKKVFVGLVAVMGIVAPAVLMIVGLMANGAANMMKFGQVLANVFRKATGSTKVLTDQTDYMNSEQIEAAAIAASLNQVHNDLIQTFTGEAAAVELLVKAYDKAIARQKLMMQGKAVGTPGAGPTKATGFAKGTASVPGYASGTMSVRKYAAGTVSVPRLYAKGIFSVPGPKGKGDIVPAMLSPGEAVIPTKVAQKYSPLIAGIISDNIPGFQKGRFEQAHLTNKLDPSDPNVRKQLEVLYPGITESQMGNMEILSDLTMEMPSWMNQDMKSTAGGVDPERFREASGGVKDKLLGSAQAAAKDVGLDVNEATLAGLSQGLEDDITNRAADLAKKAGVNVTDEVLSQATDEVLSEAKAGGGDRGKLAEGLEGRSKMVGGHRGKLEGPGSEDEELRKLIKEGRAGVRKGPQGGAETYMLNPDGSLGPKIGRFTDSGSRKAGKDFFDGQKANEHGVFVDDKGRPIAPPSEARLRGTSLDRARVEDSPGFSKRKGIATVEDPTALARDKKVAADTARKTAAAAKKKADADNKSAKATEENTKTTKENTKATKQKTEKTKKSAATKETPQGRQLSDDPRNVRRREIAAERRRKQQLAQEQKMRDSGTTGDVTPEMRARRKAAQAREKQIRAEVAQLNRQAGVSNMAEQQVKKQGIIGRLQERMLRRKQARLAREQALAVQETAVNSRGRGVRMGAAGAGMGVSGLMMAASMAPGAIGETAGKLMMPMMALSMVLPMMKNKFMAVIVVIGALIAAFMFVKDAFNKAAKEAADLALSLGSGKKAMNALAEQAGKVTATEVMDRRRSSIGQPFDIAPGKTTFGEAFMSGDLGEEFVENLSKSLESGGTEAVKAQLINQLGTAVASGALTAGQARSLVFEVSKQLGDASFGIEVNSKLISLLGPDGENLLTDPLNIRVRLIEESRERIREEAGPVTGRVNRRLAEGAGTGLLAAGAGALAGAGIGNLLGKVVAGIATRAAVGAAVGAVATPAGSAIGGIVGTVAGIATGVKQVTDAFQDAGKAAGTVTAFGVIALQQQQQLLDSLDLDFEKRIASARAAGDLVKAGELELELLEARQELLKENQETMDTIVSSFTGAGMMAQMAMRTSMDEIFKDMGNTGLEKMAIQSTVQAIEDAFKPVLGIFGGDAELEAGLKFLLLSDQISPGELLNLINTFGEDRQVLEAAIQVVTNLGTADGGRALAVMNMFEDPEQKAQFILNVEANDSANALRYVELFEEISRVGTVADLQIVMDFYLKDPSRVNRLNNDLNRIREIAAEGPTEISAFFTVISDEAAQEALLAYNAEFQALPPEQQILYIETFRTVFETVTDEEVAAFGRREGVEGATAGNVASFAADRLVTASRSSAGIDSDGTEEIASSGQKANSVLDDLLKRLRDVRKLQIDVTAGWVESSKKLNELFGGGRTIDVFAGLEQQMRAVGAQEDLITMIAGMPPEEFERAKHQLFNFDAAGNIVSMTHNLRNMGEAFKAIALGDFHNEQQRVTRNINEQIVAMRKLTAAGLDTSQAYQAVQNAAFASAVAHEKNAKVIRDLVKVTKEAKEMTEAFAAAQSVASKSQEVANLRNAASFAKINFGALSEAQKNLVLTDTNIQTLIRTNVDPAALRQALKDAEEKANLELEIKKLTFEGRVQIFEEGFNKAMEKFRVLETEVKLRFEAEKEPYLKAIKQAEREIADIRSRVGGLNELEADLERIAFKEREINKVYDQRIEALDKVEKINNSINRQAKGQLDIADALSKGDIAAAASAVQQARAEAAEAAMKARRDRLEEARTQQLAKLTGNAGLNREVIEERIFVLQKEIFNIEQQRIVPNQRQVELIERTEQALIEGLLVLGKTKTEWEQIKNRVDIAKVSTDEFRDAMQNALDIVEDIVNYWNEFDESPKNIQINEKTVREIEEIVDRTVNVTEIKSGTGGDPTSDPFDTPLIQSRSNQPRRTTPGITMSQRMRDKGIPEIDTSIALATSPEAALAPWIRPLFGLETSGFKSFESTIGGWRDGLLNSITGGNFNPTPRSQNKDVLQRRTDTADAALRPKTDSWWDNVKSMFSVAKPEQQTTSSASTGFQGPAGGGGGDKFLGGGPLGFGGNFSGTMPAMSAGGSLPLSVPSYAQKPDFLESPQPPTTGGSGPVPMLATPNIGLSLLSSIGKAFTPQAVSKEVTPGISKGIAQPIRDAGKKTPSFFSGFTNFFKRDVPKTTQPSISSSISNPLKDIGKKASGFLGGITNFFKSDVPKTTVSSIQANINKPLQNTGTRAPGLLGGITNFFSKTIPETTKPILERVLPTSFGTLNRSAVGQIGGISSAFTGMPRLSADAIERRIPGQFASLGSSAITQVGSISSAITGLPGQTENAIEGDIPSQFAQASAAARGSVGSVLQSFMEIARYVSNTLLSTIRTAFSSISTMGTNVANGIANAFAGIGSRVGSGVRAAINSAIAAAKQLSISSPNTLFGLRVPDWARGTFKPFENLAYLNKGGVVPGMGNTDTVPAMLTPGEFVVRKFAVQNFGIENLKAINEGNYAALKESSGTSSAGLSGSVYNYSLSVNVKSDANADQIARTVIDQIKTVDSQRIRGNRF